MNNTIWIYGSILAIAILTLLGLEYFYSMDIFPTPVYIAATAFLFTGLGIWVGKKITGTSATAENEKAGFNPNEEAIESLGLNEQELEVLEHLAKGQSNQEIANNLYLSINTVKTHLSNLYDKLEVSRRSMAVKKGRSLKLIP